MNWESIADGIEADARADDDRLRRALQRSQAIQGSWRELRDSVFSHLATEVGKLNEKLHASNVLEYANDLTVTADGDSCAVQSRAFPMIELSVVCVPGERIVVSGKQFFSAIGDAEEIRKQKFRFTVDRDYRACIEGEKRQLHPLQVADEITAIVATFYRKSASRA